MHWNYMYMNRNVVIYTSTMVHFSPYFRIRGSGTIAKFISHANNKSAILMVVIQRRLDM